MSTERKLKIKKKLLPFGCGKTISAAVINLVGDENRDKYVRIIFMHA